LLGKIRDSLEKSLFDYCRESGFLRPTPFQKTVIPYILQGRDVFADISGASGKTMSVLLALTLRIESREDPRKAVIVIDSEDGLKKLAIEMKRIFQVYRQGASWAVAGLENNIKKEIRQLEKPINVLAGTAVRIIDHIRRENLDIGSTDVLFVIKEMKGTEAGGSGFDKDILFIHSKLAKKPQIVLYEKTGEPSPELAGLLQRPVTLSSQDWSGTNFNYIFYQVQDSAQKPKALIRILGDLDLRKTVIIAKAGPAPAAIEKNLNAYGYACIQAGGQSRNFGKDSSDYCVASFKTNLDKEIDQARNLVYYDVPVERSAYLKSLGLLAWGLSIPGFPDAGRETPHVIFIGTREDQDIAVKISEANRMTTKKDENPMEKDELEDTIKRIMTAIKEEADPEELNFLKGVIRKHVPLSMRGYFTAYLLKQQPGTKTAKTGTMQTLFVSIGKNRSIFPKDLAKFFASSLNISQSEIGTIKILDNYSFIEIGSDHAQKAIDALDGKEFKGRKITVNFARKKDDKS